MHQRKMTTALLTVLCSWGLSQTASAQLFNLPHERNTQVSRAGGANGPELRRQGVTTAAGESAPPAQPQPVRHAAGVAIAAPQAVPGHTPGYVYALPSGVPNPPIATNYPGYPYLNAPMYPCPQPHVPIQVGGAVITNQAFYPQEMLYPHKYQAMYPPYYYKVSGGWVVTPLGVYSRDHWELQGTKVTVKYKSYISHLTQFKPPVGRHH